MNHSCPIKGCSTKIAPDRLMCSQHWYMVPVPLQRTIRRLWNNGQRKAGHDEACASAIEQVQSALDA